MNLNEKKYTLVFFISKYNSEALSELGYYEGITAAMQEMSGKVTKEEGIENNYLKQRRDEFNIFWDNGRAGYRNRKPMKSVQKIYENWAQIKFGELTEIVKAILANLSDVEIMRLDNLGKIMRGLQS